MRGMRRLIPRRWAERDATYLRLSRLINCVHAGVAPIGEHIMLSLVAVIGRGFSCCNGHEENRTRYDEIV